MILGRYKTLILAGFPNKHKKLAETNVLNV